MQVGLGKGPLVLVLLLEVQGDDAGAGGKVGRVAHSGVTGEGEFDFVGDRDLLIAAESTVAPAFVGDDLLEDIIADEARTIGKVDTPAAADQGGGYLLTGFVGVAGKRSILVRAAFVDQPDHAGQIVLPCAGAIGPVEKYRCAGCPAVEEPSAKRGDYGGDGMDQVTLGLEAKVLQDLVQDSLGLCKGYLF